MAFDEPWLAAASFVFGLVLLTVPIAGRIGGGGGRTQAKLRGGAVVIDGIRAKIWAGRAMFVVIAAAGVVLAVRGPDRVLGALMAVGCGVILVISLTQAGGRFRIVLDADGLTWQTGGEPERIAWDDLAAVSVFTVQGTPFLSVPGGDIALESFPVDAKSFAVALQTYAQRPQLRAELGTRRAIERLRSARELRARETVQLQ